MSDLWFNWFRDLSRIVYICKENKENLHFEVFHIPADCIWWFLSALQEQLEGATPVWLRTSNTGQIKLVAASTRSMRQLIIYIDITLTTYHLLCKIFLGHLLHNLGRISAKSIVPALFIIAKIPMSFFLAFWHSKRKYFLNAFFLLTTDLEDH